MTTATTDPTTAVKKDSKKSMKWRILTVLSICTIPLLFAHIGPDYYSDRIYQAVWDLGHIPFFALASYVIVRLLRFRVNLSGISWSLILLGGTLFLGAMVEFIQSFVGRSVSMHDVFSDFVGAFIVCALYRPIHRETPRYIMFGMRITLVVLLIMSAMPISEAVYDTGLARKQFPELSGFESFSEMGRWRGNVDMKRVRYNAAEKNYAMRAAFKGKGYEWISLWYLPYDWRGYAWFRFSIFNDSDPMDITLRINDWPYVSGKMEYSDRYNQHITLESGWNHFAISMRDVERGPATRRMDLSQIQNIEFYTRDIGHKALIYIDDLHLDKR